MTGKPKNMKDGLYSDKHLDLYLQEERCYRWALIAEDWLISNDCSTSIYSGDGLQSRDFLVLPMELFL